MPVVAIAVSASVLVLIVALILWGICFEIYHSQ